ncbi:MAG: tetratricopeptide repeat protein [Lentisphaerae bacterium]|jgi:tetratricopeptide (TPR) repeat protein|nr:tetratricopeptide repeat protein [Lentisphaerota bacterium]
MKRVPLFLVILTASSILWAAPEDIFSQAKTAYGNEKYAEAASLYESMLNLGVDNMEVYYNLANAYFRNGDLPRAIQYYRTAWHHSPRDPDIQNNLQFALDTAGAIAPKTSWTERPLQLLSKHEWTRLAAGAYCLLALFLLLALLLPRRRRLGLGLCSIPAVLLLLSAAGWWQWKTFERRPECVVLAETTVRHGPLDKALEFYRIPSGALVRQKSTQGEWVEITYDNKSGGWMKTEHVLPLSP